MRLCHCFCLKPLMTSHDFQSKTTSLPRPTRSYMTNPCLAHIQSLTGYLPCFLSWKSQMHSCFRASVYAFLWAYDDFSREMLGSRSTSPPFLLRGYWSLSPSLIILYKIKPPPSTAALSNPFIFIYFSS